jgi:hypothetical protein
MHEQDQTDAKLAYWIEKYLLFQRTRTMSSLVGDLGSSQIRDMAASQNTVCWVEFLYGKVSVTIAIIQEIHCPLSLCRMTGDDWMKHFIAKLLQVLHSQWLYRNFTLHDKMRSYLHLERRKKILKEVDCLMDTNPAEIPQGSQYLLEKDFISLYKASFERQSYWVLAMKAAWQARCCAEHNSKSRGASHRRRQAKAHKPRVVYNISRDTSMMNHILQLETQSRRRPHHSSTNNLNPSNKRRKLD